MVRQDTSGLKNLIRPNWFKILIILVFGYVVMQKDFSLNFNLNAPQEGEHTRPQPNGRKKKN